MFTLDMTQTSESNPQKPRGASINGVPITHLIGGIRETAACGWCGWSGPARFTQSEAQADAKTHRCEFITDNAAWCAQSTQMVGHLDKRYYP